ncbi:MAG: SMC family ATPase [Candidatus Anstonellaceae archaeon]
MITKLVLENFKSHMRTQMNFKKGTNILIGRMGSGKSSVLDAICFALYGTFPRLSRRDTSTEDLVRFGSGALFATIQLEFEKGGKKYSVLRRVGKGISEAEVRCEGKLMQKGAKQVTAYIEDVLGVDYELFTRAIYSEQNRMDFLLSLNPKERKEEIDWLLGLGQFDAAMQNAQNVCFKLEQQAKALSLPQDDARLEEVSKQLQQQKQALAECAQEIEMLGLELQKAAAKKQEAEKEFGILEQARKKWAALFAEAEKIQAISERLEKELEGQKVPSKESEELLAKKIAEAERELKQKKGELESCQRSFSEISSRIAVLESQLRAAAAIKAEVERLQQKAFGITKGKKLQQMEGEIEAAKEQLQKLETELAQSEAKEKELEAVLCALSAADAQCPICGTHLGKENAKALFEQKRKEKEIQAGATLQLRKAIEAKRAELGGLESAVSEARLVFAEIEALSKQQPAVNLAAEIAQMKEQKAECQKNLEAAQQELLACQQRKSEIERESQQMRLLAEKFEEARKAKGKLEKLKAELREIRFSEEAYADAQKRLSQAGLEWADARQKLNGKQEQLAMLEKLVAALEGEVSQIRQRKEKAQKYIHAAENLRIYKNCLAAAQVELRNSLVDEINLALAEIWPSLYPYSDYEQIKLEADEKDYRLLMFKDGWREVETIASGGERACLCLALRVAFAAVLTPDLGWLVLDEPTHNLDSDAVSLLSEAIQTKIPQIVAQTFVITHDSSLGQATYGTVWQLERDKGTGQPTQIVQIA